MKINIYLRQAHDLEDKIEVDNFKTNSYNRRKSVAALTSVVPPTHVWVGYLPSGTYSLEPELGHPLVDFAALTAKPLSTTITA